MLELGISSIWTTISGLLGGLALFLLGLDSLTRALDELAGARIRKILASFTANRVQAAASGAVVTAVIQSSSITTVLCVGFVSSGLLNLTQAIGVILGANVGTVVTGHIIAFDIMSWGLPLVTAGVGFLLMGRSERQTRLGRLVLGLGLIFFGMHMMSESTLPLRDSPQFVESLLALDGLWQGLLIGALFTAVVQSSSATIGVVIILAGQGLVSLKLGVAVILGANIGTCLTALLAALGKGRVALQTAYAHIIFNVVGTLIWLPALDWLIQLSVAVSPESNGAAGHAIADAPRQLANANTIFKFVTALLFLPFTVQLARLLNRLIPEKASASKTASFRLKHLAETYRDAPNLAIDQARKALVDLGNELVTEAHTILRSLKTREPKQFTSLRKRCAERQQLHRILLESLTHLPESRLEPRDKERQEMFLQITTYLDYAEGILAHEAAPNCRNLLNSLDGQKYPSLEAAINLCQQSIDGLTQAILAFENETADPAEKAIRLKAEAKIANASVLKLALAELQNLGPEQVDIFHGLIALSEDFKRLAYVGNSIAKVVRGALPKDPQASG